MPEDNESLYNLTKTPAGAKKTISFSFPLVIIPVLLIIIGTSVFIYFWLIKKPAVNTPSSSTPKPTISQNPQTTQGTLLGVWGTITSINDYLAASNNEATNEAGVSTSVIAVNGDNNKIYQVQVNKKTLINKYQGATQKDPPKFLTDKAVFSELKPGDRLYVSTRIDLQKITAIPIDKIITLDWYPVPAPAQ